MRGLLWLLMLALTGDRTPPTTRLVQPEVRRAFYRSGGRHLLGRRVHLHLESARLRRRPRVLATRRSGEFLVFENRSVPVVIYSRNPYWRQVQRHLADAREMCLKGRLQIPDWDPRRRIHLLVSQIKRAPGTWR